MGATPLGGFWVTGPVAGPGLVLGVGLLAGSLEGRGLTSGLLSVAGGGSWAGAVFPVLGFVAIGAIPIG